MVGRISIRHELNDFMQKIGEHIGAFVSSYTNNEYESKDLDFISPSDVKSIEKALREIGFTKSSEKHFTHPETEFFDEFSKPPLAIGNRPIKEWATQFNQAEKLQLLTPTHSVMDRLAGNFDWSDRQNLDQAFLRDLGKSSARKNFGWQ